MPDTTSLELPQGKSGTSVWVVLGAVAGVVGIVLLLRNQGQGTTAAATSINAALGSIQEENMNLLGTTQQGFLNTSTQVGGLSTQVDQGFAAIANQLTGGFAGIHQEFTSTQGLIGHLQSDIDNQFAGINSQLTAFSSQTNNNFTNLLNVVQTGQASQNQVNQQTQALLQSIQQDVNSGLVNQAEANSLLQSIQTFQIWEFYQIPNRYSAEVPSPYQSVNVGTH